MNTADDRPPKGKQIMTNNAPGAPGIEPRWTSSAKEGIGTAHGQSSPVWFTLSHGILNEIYYPRIDEACIRDAQFLVVTPDGRFVDEKRDATHTIETVGPGVPAYDVDVSDPGGLFTLAKRYVTDPLRPAVLVDVAFDPIGASLGDYSVIFLIASHIGNQGGDNTAWVGVHKGTPMVFSRRDDVTVAVAVDSGVLNRSVGFVGVSDAWQDLDAHHRLTTTWEVAEHGNVAMAIQPDLDDCDGRFTLTVAFGRNEREAGHHAIAALRDGFSSAADRYVSGWRDWFETITLPADTSTAQTSASVLATHEAKTFAGGLIASLSIPWGAAQGDGDLGGYHLVWPRDHVEAAGGLFAIGADVDGLRALSYLRATQEADGHWSQNMWLDGTPYWGGVQIDETALPILLVDLARDTGALDPEALDAYWPMVRAAAAYVVANGPVTGQDRWEEDGGYSPFTLATEIAALLVAADMAEARGEAAVATYLRDTADTWDAHIETWCYATGTELAQRHGVHGYYVRIGSTDPVAAPVDGMVAIKNRTAGSDLEKASSVVSPDALALVRFGLRSADDPRILDTINVIDASLRERFDYGSGWHRYTGDGYGEHPDGTPFDGAGQGRVWPLLTGERGHYALAAGDVERAQDLAHTMEAMAAPSGLIPEQVWDADDIPERELVRGSAAGSARPLVWAHAEYLKLLRSIRDGAVFDLPSAVVDHHRDPASDSRRFWRPNHQIGHIRSGDSLRIELREPSMVHWSTDGWSTATDTDTVDTGIGMHVVQIPATTFPAGGSIVFTVKGPEGWEGVDHIVDIERSPA